MSGSRQGRYWLLTIRQHLFTPYLPPTVTWIRGQLEEGSTTGYLHWQVVCSFGRSVRLAHVKKTFGEVHAELTRSAAADEYPFKDDTAIPGTRFDLGKKAVVRSSTKDWQAIFDNAAAGDFDSIPADIKVRSYNTLKSINRDHLKPVAMEREVFVYWGEAGTGKSRRAWEEASFDAYPKDPCSKFWDGYSGQKHVVIDEFRGDINLAHFLRWLDRYPVTVDVKFGATCLKAEKIWITSNVDPRDWYPNANSASVDGLLRRMSITHFNKL